MPRAVIVLVVILLFLIAGMVFLSRSVREQPVRTIESDVPIKADAK